MGPSLARLGCREVGVADWVLLGKQGMGGRGILDKCQGVFPIYTCRGLSGPSPPQAEEARINNNARTGI